MKEKNQDTLLKEKNNSILKEAQEGLNSGNIDNPSEETFFCDSGVVLGCYKPITERFHTLLLENGKKQQELADYLGIDKGYMSRICHGIKIPPLRIRMKIAKFFGTDSALIWRISDLIHINKVKDVENGK